jgi:hypothetical protein
VSSEQRELLISVLKSCQQKLPGMFLHARETSGARLSSEDRTHGSMSRSNESVGENMPTFSPPAQSYFPPDFEIANYSSDPSLSASRFSGISTLSPDIHTSGHIPSPDSCHDSGYDSLLRGSKNICNNSHTGSDRLVPQSFSFNPTWEGFDFDMFPLPMLENSTIELDYLLSGPVQKTDSDVEKCPSREDRE